jgi:predicted kinase
MATARLAQKVSTVVDGSPSQNFYRALDKKVPPEHRETVARMSSGKAKAEGRQPTSGDVDRTWGMIEQAITTGAATTPEGESTVFDREWNQSNEEARFRKMQHIDDRQNLMFACQIPARTDGEFIIARRPANVPADAEIVIRVMIPIESAREGEKAA